GLRGWLAVEDPLHAEGLARRQRCGRRPKGQRELRRSLFALPDLTQQRLVARVALEVLRRGVGLRNVGKVDLLGPVLVGLHRDAGELSVPGAPECDSDESGLLQEVDRIIAGSLQRGPRAP